MKKVVVLALALAALWGWGVAWAQDGPPSLVGTWESKQDVVQQHSAETGHKPWLDKFLVVIEGQEGRSFWGHKQHIKGAKVVKEKISGVIFWDNKTIYTVDHGRGHNHATIISPAEIEGVYLEEGRKARAVLYKWKKIK